VQSLLAEAVVEAAEALEDRKIEVMTVPQAEAAEAAAQDCLVVEQVQVVMMEREDFLKEMVVNLAVPLLVVKKVMVVIMLVKQKVEMVVKVVI
jgi:hypothetical protein